MRTHPGGAQKDPRRRYGGINHAKTGQKLNDLIIASLVVALACFILERQTLNRGTAAMQEPVAVTEPVSTVVPAEVTEASSHRSIAVSPFVNMSSDKEQDWACESLKALDAVEQAVNLDPEFARAYAWFSPFWSLRLAENQLMSGITTISRLGCELMSDKVAAERLLQTVDEQQDFLTIDYYTTYQHFDPRKFPNFMQKVAGQGLDDREPVDIPYRCNR